MTKRVARLWSLLFAFVLLFGGLPDVMSDRASITRADDTAWENGKAYTAMLRDAAEAAAQVVAEATQAVADAKQYVEAAKAALEAAKGTSAAASALAALAAAEAALAVAEAALLAAEQAAAVAAAALAAATVGTLIGQGLRGLWSWCWDPVCDVTAIGVGSGPIYSPATDAETSALVLSLVSITTGQTMARADFTDVEWDFMFQGAHMFIGAARGAAAATDGRPGEVIAAVKDLKIELEEYALSIDAFADVLGTTTLVSPLEDVQTERQAFDSAVEEAISQLDTGAPDVAEALTQLGLATDGFLSAEQNVASTEYPPLVGPNGALQDLSLAEFGQFLDDCSTQGVDCLPPEEVAIADTILEAAGVYFPTMESFGPAIAAYDAEGGDIGGREAALFNPNGLINLAELLSRSVEDAVVAGGPWLSINLNDSPVTQWALTSTSPGNDSTLYKLAVTVVPAGTEPGLYFQCRAAMQQAGLNLSGTVYCYTDSAAIVVNPEAVPGGDLSCPPAAPSHCGGGFPGAPPPPPFGDVNDQHASIQGFIDSDDGEIHLSSCLEDRDGQDPLGNVYWDAVLDGTALEGTVDLWVAQPLENCVGGAPTGTPIDDAQVAYQALNPGGNAGYDLDADGCADTLELTDTPNTGGLRDPFNHYDYFNPTKDGVNRVDDILAVVNEYFNDDPPGAIDFASDTDRTAIIGGNAWNLGPPNGLQRVDDILAAVTQYFHDC